MRICYQISTSKIIEMQSGGSEQSHLDNMIEAAKNTGRYTTSDIGCVFEEREPPTKHHTKYDGIEFIEDLLEKTLASNNLIIAELGEIDVKTIRSLRELVVKLFPEEPLVQDFISPYENEAELKRDKLK